MKFFIPIISLAILLSQSTTVFAVEKTTSQSSPLTNEKRTHYREQEIKSKYQEVMANLRKQKEKRDAFLSRLERYKEYHYPIIEGKKVLPIPYLTLPFRKADVHGRYDITEGWMYSTGESAIHGFTEHDGVDFALPYGTPVVAPADGYAMSSYHTFWILNEDGSKRTYEGKPIRFGLGYFVQMYIPSVNRYIQIAHLSDVDAAIPFSTPSANGEDWVPSNHTLSVPDLKMSPQYVKVRKGQVIGKVGFSGLGWGYEEYEAGATRPIAIDPTVKKSWDEPHIHFEDFWRDQTTGVKMANRDPYGIYGTTADYPTPTRKGEPMMTPLFLRGINPFLPKFADE